LARRIAALYDIHGNLPALDAVLEDVQQADVDAIVVGGDVLPGPMVAAAIDRLLRVDVPIQFIQGNCEVAVLAHLAGTEPDWHRHIPESARQITRWQAEHLDPRHRRAIAGWPLTYRVGISGLGDVLFCHATPRHENEIFTRLTPEDRLLPLFEGLGVSLVVCGHTHMQFDRMVGRVRVVNAGSVGMPFGAPGADWLLLEPDVSLRHTVYDLAAAAERVRASDYPQADEFASGYILQPPPEAQMLELFTAVSLK
jgi:predicted phosphodiesterase